MSSDVMSIEEARKRKQAKKRVSQEPLSGFAIPPPPPHPSEARDWEEPPEEPVDPWSPGMLTENSGYDEDAFYTATSIGDEGTTQISVTISRSMAYSMDAIVQSGRLPVGVSQDIVRDAIAHWLHKRSHRLPDHIAGPIVEAMNRHVYLARMEARRRARKEVEAVLSTTREELETARSNKDKAEFVTVLESARGQVVTMTGPGRDEMERVIGGAEEGLKGWQG